MTTCSQTEQTGYTGSRVGGAIWVGPNIISDKQIVTWLHLTPSFTALTLRHLKDLLTFLGLVQCTEAHRKSAIIQDSAQAEGSELWSMRICCIGRIRGLRRIKTKTTVKNDPNKVVDLCTIRYILLTHAFLPRKAVRRKRL